MSTTQVETNPIAVRRPPWAMAWVLLLASAAAVLLIGFAATAFILGNLAGPDVQITPGFWVQFLGASALTTVALALRSLRWIFLLRRTETRIPIRDAYIGYFAGFSLLFAPFLLGEIAVRASVLRTRGRVPIATTIVVDLWERLLDVIALAVIAAVLGIAQFGFDWWTIAVVAVSITTFVMPLRRMWLRAIVTVSTMASVAFERRPPADFTRLARQTTWFAALAASIAAWTLPGIGFWLLVNAAAGPVGVFWSTHEYAASALRTLTLAPGGIVVVGTRLLDALGRMGVPDHLSALTVLADRLATSGVAAILGVVFVVMHFRSARLAGGHFDQIADAYDVQIPEARRHALLARKTEMMCEVINRSGRGRRGLDVGCGQGAYVGRMRELGFDVTGIDSSAAQIALAIRNLDAPHLVTTGSLLEIPANDASYDFIYAINVVHHLESIDEQRRAFRELFRVLRPGGLLFVHEINTRNALFRFYMGYVFPSLNCIDEGVERWLRPNHLAMYTDAPVIETRYFTFLPDFLPRAIVDLLAPIERRLERSRFASYSAHYMAVFRKTE